MTKPEVRGLKTGCALRLSGTTESPSRAEQLCPIPILQTETLRGAGGYAVSGGRSQGVVSHGLVQSCPDNRDREVLNSSCDVGRQRLGGRCVLRLWLCLHFLFVNGAGITCTPKQRWWWCGEVDASLWGQSLPRQNLSHTWPFPVSENDWTVCLRVSAPKAGRTPLHSAA